MIVDICSWYQTSWFSSYVVKFFFSLISAKNVGECAVLQFPHRYIYYLITKKAYYHKPTYADLEASLVQMKKHIQANGVKELSIPQLGCGLDRLVWKKVSAIIKEVFAHVDISITVYIFIKSSK